MNGPAEPSSGRRLRVAIEAADALRRQGLAALVDKAGHDAVAAADDADIVVGDGAKPIASDLPVLIVGGNADAGEGWVHADIGAAQLDAALQAVAAGLIVRSPGVEANGFGAIDDPGAPLLTPREIHVLSAIADGLSNKEAARRLGISPHTVKFHIESVFRKLDVTTRAEAVKKGLRLHRIEL